MNKRYNKIIGKKAEDIAMNALKQKGYHIIDRNVSYKQGEIDIVAQDGQVLVFVEVKAKTGHNTGIPEEMITKKKLERVRLLGTIYLKGNNEPCRIDIVAIVFNSDYSVNRITHYINVY